MTAKPPTTVDLVLILDRSGSMQSQVPHVIKGYNDMLAKQREIPGDAWWTVHLFDNEHITMHSRLPIMEVPELSEETYVPRNSTALYTAIVMAVANAKKRIAGTPEDERADVVQVIVMTDGRNNCFEHTKEDAKRVIEEQEKEGWEFVFIGADINESAEGSSMGLRSSNVLGVGNTREGTSLAYEVTSDVVSSTRRGGRAAGQSFYSSGVRMKANLTKRVPDPAPNPGVIEYSESDGGMTRAMKDVLRSPTNDPVHDEGGLWHDSADSANSA